MARHMAWALLKNAKIGEKRKKMNYAASISTTKYAGFKKPGMQWSTSNPALGTGWDRANFLHSGPYGALLWICNQNSGDSTWLFALLLNSGCTSSRISPFLTPSYQGAGWGGQEDTAGMADPNSPHNPTPYNVMLSNKNEGLFWQGSHWNIWDQQGPHKG